MAVPLPSSFCETPARTVRDVFEDRWTRCGRFAGRSEGFATPSGWFSMPLSPSATGRSGDAGFRCLREALP